MAYRVVPSQRPSPGPVAPAPRVHLLAIDERPSGVDPVLGQIFRSMRATLALPIDEMARRVGTTPQIVEALEAGLFRTLPPGQQGVAVVAAYGRLLALDVSPILNRIAQQSVIQGPLVRNAAAPPIAGAPVAAGATQPHTPAVREHPSSPSASRAGRRVAGRVTGLVSYVRRLKPPAAVALPGREQALALLTRLPKRSRIAMGLAVLVLTAAAWTANSGPNVLYAAVDTLPQGLALSLRQKIDRLMPARDGLTWVEATDPRKRKADRLIPQQQP